MDGRPPRARSDPEVSIDADWSAGARREVAGQIEDEFETLGPSELEDPQVVPIEDLMGPFVVLWVCLVGIGPVDASLGARAEYLNAAAIVAELGRALQGAELGQGLPLFRGAESLSPRVRLVVGLGSWALEALVVAALLWSLAQPLLRSIRAS